MECRFRLQEEGKPYFRSVCGACGRTVSTGLGSSCKNVWPSRDTPSLPVNMVDEVIAIVEGMEPPYRRWINREQLLAELRKLKSRM